MTSSCRVIPGTPVFDGRRAQCGYALNEATNRQAFREFDLMCMSKLTDNPAALIRYSVEDLVEHTGSQGIELMMWIAARGVLTGAVTRIHGNYPIPISNTAAALLALASASEQAAGA